MMVSANLNKPGFTQQLLDALKGRKAPLDYHLEKHGVIVANNYDFEGPFSVSVTFHHPEGDIVIGSNWPSRTSMAGLDQDTLLKGGYDEIANHFAEHYGFDWKDPHQCPWLRETDRLTVQSPDGLYAKLVH